MLRDAGSTRLEDSIVWAKLYHHKNKLSQPWLYNSNYVFLDIWMKQGVFSCQLRIREDQIFVS